MFVRITLIQIAEKMVKTLIPRNAGGSLFSDSPFADRGGFVTHILKDLTDGDIQIKQGAITITAHSRVPGMLPRHETTSRRCTGGTAGVMLSESHPLLRELINPRCLEQSLAVTPDITDAKVVRHNVDDIRLICTTRKKWK